MTKAINILDAISDWTGKVFSFLIWIGIAVTLFEVVSRYVFNAPTLWAMPFNQRLFAFYFLIGGAYGVLTQAHIVVDVAYKKFPPRFRAFVDVFLYPLLLFAVCFIFIWYGCKLGLASLKILEIDYSLPHFPIYPVKLLIPIAGFLLLLQGVAELMRNLMKWRQRGQ